MKKAAGVLLICKRTGNFLLLKRSDQVTYSNRWAVVAGAVEKNESPLQTIKRELKEETQIPSNDIVFEFFETQNLIRSFDLFIGYCDKEYECILNEENSSWGWFNMNNLPTPLFPTLYSSLVKIF